MWEYKSEMPSTYHLLGWMHLSVDRQRSTDKKLYKKKKNLRGAKREYLYF